MFVQQAVNQFPWESEKASSSIFFAGKPRKCTAKAANHNQLPFQRVNQVQNLI